MMQIPKSISIDSNIILRNIFKNEKQQKSIYFYLSNFIFFKEI